MPRRRSSRSSPVGVNVSIIIENAVTVEGQATTASDEQRGGWSDTPYSAGAYPEEPQGDAYDGRAASSGSGREWFDGGQLPPALVIGADDIEPPNQVTETSPHGVPQANEGLTPAQQSEKVIKSVAGGIVGEDKKVDDSWSLCADEVWKFEERQVNKWKENISNLLLFAGLFSTILAAFLAAFYMLLSPQAPDATTQVLVVMSIQLSLLTAAVANHNLTNTQQATLDAAIATTAPTTTTISTGVLWFIAVIFSLSAASISIAVGQWLHHHIDRASSLSRQSVRIWSLRRRGLQKWHVQAIIDSLPILLQISLASFLVGLLNIVWRLDYVVASISTIIIATLLLPTLFTIFMPYFDADCPYKSRAAWWCFVILNRFTHSRCTVVVVKCGKMLWMRMSNMVGATTRRVLSLRGFPAAARCMLSGLREILTLNQLVRLRPAAMIAHVAKRGQSLTKSLLYHMRKLPSGAARTFSVLLQIVTHRLTNIQRRLPKFGRNCGNRMRWYPRIPESWSKWHLNTLGARNWREFENVLVRAANTPEEEKLMVLAEADEMIMDDAFLVNVVHPCFQNGSLESAVPALLRILRHRAHKVIVEHHAGCGVTVLKWLTSEQDSAAIIAMADLCIDVLLKYDSPGSRNSHGLVDHLLQLIRAMPLIDPARMVCDRARDLIQWAATHQWQLHEAHIDALVNGADDRHSSLKPFLNILLKEFKDLSPKADSSNIVLTNCTLHILEKLAQESWEGNAEHQLLVLKVIHEACNTTPSAASVYANLPRLFLSPTLALSQDALDYFVTIIDYFHYLFRLNIESMSFRLIPKLSTPCSSRTLQTPRNCSHCYHTPASGLVPSDSSKSHRQHYFTPHSSRLTTSIAFIAMFVACWTSLSITSALPA
ncbi:hypothetical protein IEO21_09995 [Rhodonia placenta]|uniref:DUF6535 domain-containing protein n=1 Tax=Rhodonia placenta TaxID=104341 RepID=A0A8H7TXY2_9APHY|nr:hypothetical protein IEO21_09995 [Postia placenta]